MNTIHYMTRVPFWTMPLATIDTLAEGGQVPKCIMPVWSWNHCCGVMVDVGGVSGAPVAGFGRTSFGISWRGNT